MILFSSFFFFTRIEFPLFIHVIDIPSFIVFSDEGDGLVAVIVIVPLFFMCESIT